eukprot:TRINITY_DN3789_c0_g1_i1.p4 TRINITY_DN3789_c0_g1~~TRINITY_DN3789_c0_g1_i1.p4  ORF type:complete len:217 (+),score=25.09 TRINITY_DN3789_c0_g1_i1:1689-2339(+)
MLQPRTNAILIYYLYTYFSITEFYSYKTKQQEKILHKNRINRRNVLLMDLVPTASSLLKYNKALNVLEGIQDKSMENCSFSPIIDSIDEEKNELEQGSLTLPLEPIMKTLEEPKEEAKEKLPQLGSDAENELPEEKAVPHLKINKWKKKSPTKKHMLKLKGNEYWTKVVRKHFVPVKNERKEIELEIMKMRQQKAPKKKFNFVQLSALQYNFFTVI